ncbi:MAG: polysaccharide deacetylase family protein [Bacteroidales bacterium]|jgi:peptidoglycan/xylan/chitin deacetylase (PgdA/CDA1 family)|nr:polysaccharide deacetylase family protein [Bacteroidales bacterium]MDD4058341.1 polysaccharide deacetylase family protein [Bacteroidales bacterium]
MIVVGIITVLIVVTILIAAAFRMDWGVYLNSYCREKSIKEGGIMITFDDGPHSKYTEEVLDVLKKRGVKALFFLIGERALENPQLVRRIAEEGHIIGIHSLRHTIDFTISSRIRVLDDLKATKRILEELSGQNIRLFRPPFGVTNPQIGRAVNDLDLMSVGWSIRSFDTLSSNNIDRTLKRVKRRIDDGAILLLHDRLPQSANLLENILDYMKLNGYEAKIFKRVL